MDDLWTKASVSLRPHPESAGDPNRDYSLQERMHLYNVSACSIAVIHDGRLEVEVGVGQLAADDSTAASAQTVFGACSISKAISAIAALRLVAVGKVPLDADMNNHLRDWRIKDANDRPANITLRQLLTHTAGVNIHGADGYDPRGAVPTLDQIFHGEPPAMSAPIRVVTTPGSKYEYSSGGMIIVQKLICDATEQSFGDAISSLVFTPLSMRHSTFRSDAAGNPRAAAHVSLIPHASPETQLVWPALAPAGLWTTAADLARLTQALQSSFNGKSDFLPQELAGDALRRQTPHNDIGLGIYLLGDGPSRRFSHMGGYLGYAAEMLGWLTGSYGMSILINNGYTGPLLKQEIIQAILRVYGWPN